MQRCSYRSICVRPGGRSFTLGVALIALVLVAGSAQATGGTNVMYHSAMLNAVDTSTTTSPSQPGFSDSVVFSGLTEPTAVRFSPDGRVFVAEKSGLIKVFDSLKDTTPTVFADLRTEVHNFWDRGLLRRVRRQRPALPPAGQGGQDDRRRAGAHQ